MLMTLIASFVAAVNGQSSSGRCNRKGIIAKFFALESMETYVAIRQYKNCYGPLLDFGISKIGGCHMAAHVIAIKFFCGALPPSCCHGTSCNQC